MASFQAEISGLLDREGGYVNDPDDPGGETKYGISRRSYPDADIPNLTRFAAAAIYHTGFWEPLRCTSYRSQLVAGVVFDAGVNLGVRRAARLLQGVLGVPVDGQVGPITLSRLNSHPDPEKLAAIFTLKRIGFYVSLAAKRSSSRKFLAGWTHRSLTVFHSTER